MMTFLRRVVMLSRTHKFGRYRVVQGAVQRANCVFAMTQGGMIQGGTIQPGTIPGSSWMRLRVMALLVLFLVLFWVAHPLRAFAANPDQDTALISSRQRIEKLDYRMTGRITRVDGNGKRTNYKFTGKAHWFPDGLRLLCEISGPGSEKTSLLLHMSATGHVSIEAVLPGEKTASALPYERWNDPLVGTDFSYEDMVENQFFWKNQEALPPEKYGARDCLVLKSKPGPQDQTYYDSVTSWLDRGILFPVHVVKTLRGTGQQKEFIYYGLRQNGGAWGASKVEAKLTGKPGYSILEVEGGSGRANLGRKDFDLRQFNAPGEKEK